MRPLLLSGLRHLRRTPGRVLQVAFAVALGVALFVSSYMSISGIEASIERSSRAAAGNAHWIVSGSGAGGVPEGLLNLLRQTPGLVAAPFLSASVTVLGPNPQKLQVLGIDTQTDAMLRFFGTQQAPDLKAAAQMALVPNSVVVTQQFARERAIQTGSTLKAATRSGPADLTVAGFIPDSTTTRALGGDLALMDIHSAEVLFGQPGRIDAIQVSGISQDRLKVLAKGYDVRGVDALSPVARDALVRVQSLYGMSLVAMLIGCFVVFSSVQVSVLERMKEVATLRALGASRVQLLVAILIEWLLVGLLGSVAGVLLGAGLSSLILRAVMNSVNSMLPLVTGARVELSWTTFAVGIAIGLVTVLAAAIIPSVGAVRESPLLALRPHTYRLRHRQQTAFWLGSLLLALGLVISVSGSYVQTLAAIALSFFGLALMLPQAMQVAAGFIRGAVAALLGFPGFLAADNLRKAPQRTAFNVIALGGALAILVSTAALVSGFTQSTHRWIRDSLPLDLSITASNFSDSLYSEETLPRSLLQRVLRLKGVSFGYGVRKSFSSFDGHDIMVIGLQTRAYVEAHRRHGSLAWAHEIADPANMRELIAGRGAFASENLIALTSLRVGDSIAVPTPSGSRRFRILGAVEDYSWPRGLLVTDLDVMSRLWHSTGLTYIDVQVSDLTQIGAVRGRIAELTQNEYSATVTDREQIIGVADDVLRQSTAAADVQVWLAAIIGFLGIGNSLIVGVLQRQREIGLLRAVGISRGQLRRTVAIEALLIGIGAGAFGMAGGLVGGWLPLRHFTFAITGYLFPFVIPWPQMAEVFVAANIIAVIAAMFPIRRITQVPVLTSISMD